MLERLKNRVRSTHGSQLLILPDLQDISSSQVRECMDIEKLDQLVVPAVLEYMQQHQLYMFADNSYEKHTE
jgi:nicotinic acid mononucleotide adenylyltransferase